MNWFPPSDGYKPEEEGPEARLARELLAEEERVKKQHQLDCEMAERLLASLTPHDSYRRLVSFASQKFWNLPRRARPVD